MQMNSDLQLIDFILCLLYRYTTLHYSVHTDTDDGSRNQLTMTVMHRTQRERKEGKFVVLCNATNTDLYVKCV